MAPNMPTADALPQAISHRGRIELNSPTCPENTMLAFRASIETGIDVLETDLHLSRDGVVDASLKRCYGIPKYVKDCDWSYLATIRTVTKPHEPMPRLDQLLEFLAGLEDKSSLKLLLDVKIDDHPVEIFIRIRETLDRAPEGNWKSRITFGCWLYSYIEASHSILPGYPIAYIGVTSVAALYILARTSLAAGSASPQPPKISVWNMRHSALVGPIGFLFLRQVARRNMYVCSWTVNDNAWMQWCIRKRLDGIITDYPSRLVQELGEAKRRGIRQGHDSFHSKSVPWTNYLVILCQQILVMIALCIVSSRLVYRSIVSKRHKPPTSAVRVIEQATEIVPQR